MGSLLGVQIWAAIAGTVGALAIIFKWGGDLWSWILSTHRIEEASIGTRLPPSNHHSSNPDRAFLPRSLALKATSYDQEAGLNTDLGPAGVQQNHVRLSALQGQRAINLAYPPPVHSSGRELGDLPPAAAATAASPLPPALPPPTAVLPRLHLRHSAEAGSRSPAPSDTMTESLTRDQMPDQAGNEQVVMYQYNV